MLKTKITTLLLASLALTLAACELAADSELGHADESVSGRPSFDLFRGQDGQYYFNLEAANHEIILRSQGYSGRTAALSGLLSVLDNAGEPTNFEVLESADGQYYFNLLAANDQIIGTSETYVSLANANRGVEAVIENVGDYLALNAARRGGRFVVFEATDGRYFFQLRATNGAIVLTSQGYSSEAAALNGTFSVAENGTSAEAYDIKPSGQSGYYFNVVAANGQVIGTGEVYDNKANAERARDAIIELLPQIELL